MLIDFPGFITTSLKDKFLINDGTITFNHLGAKQIAPIQHNTNILIKVQKIKSQTGQIYYKYSAKILSKNCRFNQLFDYQCLQQDNILDIFDSEAPYLPTKDVVPVLRPPYFTMTKWGYEYLYKENPNIKRGEKIGLTFITIGPDANPPLSNYKLSNQEPSSIRVKELIAKLQGLFEKRPMWTRVKLASVLQLKTKDIALLKALPYVGYAFKSGPFRSCVIKFGFDPRQNYANRIYQVINIQLPGMGARIRNDIQICDIENPEPGLERLLTSLLFCKPEFNYKDGFFIEGHLNTIKEYLANQAREIRVVDESENKKEENVVQSTMNDDGDELDDFDLLFD